MAEINPCNWLQNAGATHTARQMRAGVTSLDAGAQGAGRLTSRGGVNPSLGTALNATLSGGGTQVNIESGVVHVPGTEDTAQGCYICINDATVGLPVAGADGSNPRRDIVVAQIKDSFYDAGPDDEWELAVVTGVASGTPVLPTVPDNAMLLWEINVPANDSPGATLIDHRTLLSSVGGLIPIREDADLPTVGLYEGMSVFQQDTGAMRIRHDSAWNTAGSVHGFQLRETVSYTSSGSFVKDNYPGIRAVRVRCQGGGGGGGGAAATSGTQASSGSGGRGGNYAESFLLESALSASETVTVGVGGNGGTGVNGAAGGTSSFGAHVSAGGGAGGVTGGASTGWGGADADSSAGSATGQITLFGGCGPSSIHNGTEDMAWSAPGGPSVMGGGGRGRRSSTSLAGGSGAPRGGGGGGAANGNSASAQTGGDGGAGIVIVEVYV